MGSMHRILVDLTTLKVALGVDQDDHEDDAKYDWVLEAASEAVSRYADRDFSEQEAGDTVQVRQFEHDGRSGFLDIDDCTLVSSVSMYDRDLQGEEWSAHPLNRPTFHYLRLTSSGYAYGSPAMGFTRNADTLPWRNRTSEQTIVSVTALWGWPSVPKDVQQATIWTAVALAESPRPYVSESIEGYSRTLGAAPDFALPPRAQAILAPYTRLTV